MNNEEFDGFLNSQVYDPKVRQLLQEFGDCISDKAKFTNYNLENYIFLLTGMIASFILKIKKNDQELTKSEQYQVYQHFLKLLDLNMLMLIKDEKK